MTKLKTLMKQHENEQQQRQDTFFADLSGYWAENITELDTNDLVFVESSVWKITKIKKYNYIKLKHCISNKTMKMPWHVAKETKDVFHVYD